MAEPLAARAKTSALNHRDSDLGFSGPAPALLAWTGLGAEEPESATGSRRGCMDPTLLDDRGGGAVMTVLTCHIHLGETQEGLVRVGWRDSSWILATFSTTAKENLQAPKAVSRRSQMPCQARQVVTEGPIWELGESTHDPQAVPRWLVNRTVQTRQVWSRGKSLRLSMVMSSALGSSCRLQMLGNATAAEAGPLQWADAATQAAPGAEIGSWATGVG
ncbi:hypothetical protein B0I37DRAFT_359704 [Chaetomium sp. MPI-CAGE-AT-0009]|nr:hypothetical protein B0I37DRAFT_359704 [Chaetomium sp. MPI-CAGE-AT-0009]